MASFLVREAFYFRDNVRKEGATLQIGADELLKEIALGKHPDTGKPMSGLLNHCSPADKEAEEMVYLGGVEAPVPVAEMTPADEEAEKKAILAEMEGLGAFCNPAWKLVRMRKELAKAQKEKPAAPIVRESVEKPAERL